MKKQCVDKHYIFLQETKVEIKWKIVDWPILQLLTELLADQLKVVEVGGGIGAFATVF